MNPDSRTALVTVTSATAWMVLAVNGATSMAAGCFCARRKLT